VIGEKISPLFPLVLERSSGAGDDEVNCDELDSSCRLDKDLSVHDVAINKVGSCGSLIKNNAEVIDTEPDLDICQEVIGFRLEAIPS